MLNIMMVKDSAEKIASSGIVRLLRTFLTFCVETAQTGTVAAARPREITGLRYPSGMCMLGLLADPVGGMRPTATSAATL
jgi:hypothetical protein